MSENNLVTTTSGALVEKNLCRYIKKEYHKIGDVKVMGSGDCYFIEGKYWRISTGRVVFNHSINEYVLKNDNCTQGVVAVNGEDFTMGYFNSDNINSVQVFNKEGNVYNAFSEDLFVHNRYYKEDLSTGAFRSISNTVAHRFTNPKIVVHDDKRGLHYSCDEIMDDYIYNYNKYSPNQYRYSKELSKYLDKLSFGVEFETTCGLIPDRKKDKLGLMPLRDGSVDGLEYVTIPLSGKKGVNALIESSKALNKYAQSDNNCALHVHIGNIPRTKEFLLAFYRLMHLVQDEMFSMFPLYKKYNFGIKRKHYTKPLPDSVALQFDKTINDDNIDQNFEVLYTWLSGGQSYVNNFNSLDDVIYHPSDPDHNRKWQIRSRYHHVNLVPLLFGNKKTVEFRIHTGTFDVNKVVNFVALCGSIVNFVKNNTNTILTDLRTTIDNIKLSQIICNKMNGQHSIVEELSNYMLYRKSFIKNETANGSVVINEDLFKYRGYINYGRRVNFNIPKVEPVENNEGEIEIRRIDINDVQPDIDLYAQINNHFEVEL